MTTSQHTHQGGPPDAGPRQLLHERGAPKGEVFLKGVGLSTWQCSGDNGTSNWTRYANRRRLLSALTLSYSSYDIGKSNDFWNRWGEGRATWQA
jgi:hypothetical protein